MRVLFVSLLLFGLSVDFSYGWISWSHCRNNKVIVRKSLKSVIMSTHNSEMMSFDELEYTNWQRGVKVYDDGFGPLTRQCIDTLLSQIDFPPSNEEEEEYHLLDVATGPGYVLTAAAEKTKLTTKLQSPKIQLSGLDVSENFLQLASKRWNSLKCQKEVNWIVGSAERLPLKDESVNGITCNFGILHLKDPDAFLQEAHRVLKPGGKLAFSVWAQPPENEPMYLLSASISQHGNPNVPLPEAPPFFRFADPTESTRSMHAAGFTDVHVQTQTNMEWTNVSDAATLYNILLEGTARTRALLEGQTPEQSIAIQSDLHTRFEKWYVHTHTHTHNNHHSIDYDI